MNQEQVLAWAREAGFSIKTVNSIDGDEVFWFTNITDMLERFATLVAANKAEIAIAEAYRCGYEAGAAHEREACAKVCETDELCCKCGDECAAAIRARNNND